MKAYTAKSTMQQHLPIGRTGFPTPTGPNMALNLERGVSGAHGKVSQVSQPRLSQNTPVTARAQGDITGKGGDVSGKYAKGDVSGKGSGSMTQMSLITAVEQ